MELERSCLRMASCMAPNADAMCAALAELLQRELNLAVQWIDRVPWYEREQLLDAGELDLCWICGLPYVDKADSGAAIVPCVAPVMQHSRYRDQAVYFSEVVVRADSAVRSFSDLRGKCWAYNEPRSHSGFNVVRFHLAEQGLRWSFFGDTVAAGSHQAALERIVAGMVDGASIDSTVLEAELRQRPALAEQIRIVCTLGPSPSPPWVVSTRMPPQLRARLTNCLAGLHRSGDGARVLNSWGIARLQTVNDGFYGPIRRMADVAAAAAITEPSDLPVRWEMRTRSAN